VFGSSHRKSVSAGVSRLYDTSPLKHGIHLNSTQTSVPTAQKTRRVSGLVFSLVTVSSVVRGLRFSQQGIRRCLLL